MVDDPRESKLGLPLETCADRVYDASVIIQLSI